MAFNTEGAVALRIVPCTVTAGTKTITGFGTAQDFLALVSPSWEKINPEIIEYFTERLSGGITMRAPKVTKLRDGTTGLAVGSEGDAFDVTIVCVYSQIKALIALLDADPQVPLAIAFAPMLDAGGDIEGWFHMMGNISGNIKYSQAEGIAKIPVAIKGQSFVLTDTSPPDYTDYNTAVTTATITPFGTTTALTIPSLASAGNLTTLLSGKLLLVDVP